MLGPLATSVLTFVFSRRVSPPRSKSFSGWGVDPCVAASGDFMQSRSLARIRSVCGGGWTQYDIHTYTCCVYVCTCQYVCVCVCVSVCVCVGGGCVRLLVVVNENHEFSQAWFDCGKNEESLEAAISQSLDHMAFATRSIGQIYGKHGAQLRSPDLVTDMKHSYVDSLNLLLGDRHLYNNC